MCISVYFIPCFKKIIFTASACRAATRLAASRLLGIKLGRGRGISSSLPSDDGGDGVVIKDRKLRGVVAGEYAGSWLEISMEFSSSEITTV